VTHPAPDSPARPGRAGAVVTICLLCAGTGTDQGRTCPRCHGTRKDPNP